MVKGFSKYSFAVQLAGALRSLLSLLRFSGYRDISPWGRKSFNAAKLHLVLLLLAALGSQAQERVYGANATLSEIPSPRASAMGGALLGMTGDPLTVAAQPTGLLDLNSIWVGFAHVEHFQGTRYDHLSSTLALDSLTGLAFSVARFGADGIPWIREGDPLPEGSDYRTLSIADWVMSSSLARSFDVWQAGLTVHGIHRSLDQSGWGFRGDAALRYRRPQWFVAAHAEGFTGSQVRWESGWSEYSPVEFRLGGGWERPVPYLYGTLHLAWQSAGLLHRGGRRLDWNSGSLEDTAATAVSDLGGERIWDSPWGWMQEGSSGLEFRFDWGGAVRAGLATLGELRSYTLGAGLQPTPWLHADYALVNHPVLGAQHRVALAVSPGLLLRPTPALRAPIRPAAGPLAPVRVPLESKVEPGVATPADPEPVVDPAAGVHWEE